MVSKFAEKVYLVVKGIPKGKVSTYKLVAEAMAQMYKAKEYKGACRAVGNALNRNKSKEVPCHRVVRSDGFAGGFCHGSGRKTAILRKEGVIIRKGKVLDFNKRLFRFDSS